MTGDEIREGLVAAGAVIMEGCECGGRFERVDDIVVDTVVDSRHVIVSAWTQVFEVWGGGVESRIDAHGPKADA